MAQRWSDYLDKLRDGADVVQLYLMRGEGVWRKHVERGRAAQAASSRTRR